MSNENSKLKSVYNHPFMGEEDPKNPYGTNYEEAPYQLKAYNKFMKMKTFVHFDEDDKQTYSRVNGYLGWSLLGSGIAAYLTGFIVKNFIIARKSPVNYFKIQGIGFLYYLPWIIPSVLFTYQKMDDYFFTHLSEPYLKKYLEEAKSNGFKDYEISTNEFERVERMMKNMNPNSK